MLQSHLSVRMQRLIHCDVLLYRFILQLLRMQNYEVQTREIGAR